ncbi:cation channel sperm-associated auxiliary subunit delta-like [Manis pentadactyla]|uniref:cation channel sperm-associated auxiliary subunit delta-like n=1 Tax=Manis pentadactyla TaxID=143292 RepID=UPI00255C946F|nr:cation channel sperm-associated auxiliary subunit delta isoform X3 [Manis pentadactyla]XP_057352745.1 cation channel sperm-associated auxiliary subunit delta-like [Manis pentadactyla]
MLVLMLMAAGTLRFCAVTRAQELCRTRMVRTGKVFHTGHQIQGDRLYFSSMTARLIRHPCKKNLALYLGQQVFLTRDNFESSVIPFSIPTSMKVGTPELTAAHFAGSVLLFIINRKVYVYDYETDSWNASIGIEHPVSHMSGDNCCYSGSPSCLDISKSVFAYLLGDQLSQANVYFSDTQGYSFQKFAHKRQAEPDGTLGGIFYFHSLSQVGTLLVNHGQAKFSYSDHPLNLTFVLPFNYSEPLEVLIVPGQRGFLIFWFEKSLLVSVNEGQLVKPVVVQKGRRTLYSSISEANISIRGVAANTHQLAVLTRENTVYYGNLGYLSNSLIKFPKGHIWSQEAALMFTDVGMLEILTPVPDPVFPAFDFQRCLVNVQASLMDLHVDDCKVELLEGDFADKMYTVDMYGTLELTALMVPKAGTSPVPLPMLSNPHSLGIHDAIMYEDGYRYDGRTMHRMNISLRQQQFCGRADANFTSDIKRPTMSTISLDIDDKEISCVDLKPLTALISVGCDHEKEIVVRKEVSACYKGILDIMALSDNYSYVIERDAYDPNFRGQKATKDQVVHYPYDRLGCPDLVYYDNPWKPVVEMWRKGKFQEVVHTEYVLQEVNGLFTYTYSLSARSALCRAQPQNWTTVMEPAGGEGRSAWHRENYVSCHDANNHAPVRWPDVPYQILGGPTANKVLFDERNGIYIFRISIVDPFYSYCRLETTFSVYVYGALPPSIIPVEISIVLLTATILLGTWLSYVVPTLLHTGKGLRFKRFWTSLYRRYRNSWARLWGRR